MVVAETIRHARAEAGLTQSELARRAGIRASEHFQVRDWGASGPAPKTFARILRAAQVSPEVALQRNRDDVLDAVRRRQAANPRVFTIAASDETFSGADIGLLVTFRAEASMLDAAGLMLDLDRILGTPVAVISDRAGGTHRGAGGGGSHPAVTDDSIALELDAIRHLIADGNRIVASGRTRFFDDSGPQRCGWPGGQ